MANAPQQHILISIVVDRPTVDPERMAALIADVQCRYAFLEVLIGVEQHDVPEAWASVSPYVRALTLDPKLSRHMRRATLCRATIGDLVVCLPRDCADPHLVFSLLEQAHLHGSAFLRTHPARWFDHALLSLGKASQLRVDSGVSPAIAFSRASLEQTLAREDRALALRFPPPKAAMLVAGPGHTFPRDKGIRERAALVHSLAINTAPVLLTMGFWASVGAAVLGLVAALYAACMYLFADQVAEGWTTTTLLLAAGAVWGGAMGAATSAALARLMPQQRHAQQGDVVGEVGYNDLLGSLRQRHNLIQPDKDNV